MKKIRARQIISLLLVACSFLVACTPGKNQITRKEVTYITPNIKKDTNLGADLPFIIYESDQQVIFYNYMGIFIYNLSNSKITSALAPPVDSEFTIKTQGDQTTMVEFDKEDHSINIYLVGKQSPDYFHKFDIKTGKVYQHDIAELNKMGENNNITGEMHTTDWTAWNLIYKSKLTGKVYYPFRNLIE